MKRLAQLLVVILLLVGVSGLLALDVGGYALFAYHRWTLEVPLVYAIVGMVVGLLVVSWILSTLHRMLHAPRYLQAWQKQRRTESAEKKTKQGLLALVEGSWSVAEKALIKGAKDSPLLLINYLTAAWAADQQQRYRQSDDYLGQACNAVPDSRAVIELTQACLLRQRKHYDQAVLLLRPLYMKMPKNRYVIDELYRNYWALEAWNALYELLPQLKHLVTSDQELTIYKHQIQAGAVQWDDIPKHFKSELLTDYVKYLITQHAFQEAEYRLRRRLKKQWCSEWIRLYGEVNHEPLQQLEVAEQWLKHYPEDPDLLACLGMLACLNQLWGKAQHYFESSVAIKPCVTCYKRLGELFEQLGDRDAAYKYFKLATL